MNQYKPSIKVLVTIHTIMLVAMLLFTAISYFISGKIMQTKVNVSTDRVLQLVAVVLALGCTVAAFVLFKQQRKKWQLQFGGLDEKIEGYRQAVITKFALLEAPVFFACIGYMLTQNIAFMLLALVLIFVFAGQKPTVVLMTYDLNVGRDDLFE